MSTKPNDKSIISSSDSNDESKTGSNPVQSAVVKANGKTHVSSDDNRELMLFNEVSLGPQETDLRFRLIHFWEGRNPLKKTMIGLEMLLIDEHVINPLAFVAVEGDRYSRLRPTGKNQKIHAAYETRRSLHSHQLLRIQKQRGVPGCCSLRDNLLLPHFRVGAP